MSPNDNEGGTPSPEIAPVVPSIIGGDGPPGGSAPPPTKRRSPNPKGRKPRFTIAQVEEALRHGGGLYTYAARILHCAPNTIANYVNRSERLQDVLSELNVTMLDLAEANLFKHIVDSNLTALIFYLKCKGKLRGYVERQEVSGPAGAPIGVQLTDGEVAKMSDEDILSRIEQIGQKSGSGGATSSSRARKA
jgi:hypothetical protein